MCRARGIGKTTIQRLNDAANQLAIPLWDVVSDAEAVRCSADAQPKGCCSSANSLMASGNRPKSPLHRN